MTDPERSAGARINRLFIRLCVGRGVPDDPLGRTRAFVFTLATVLTFFVALFYVCFFVQVGRAVDAAVTFCLLPTVVLNCLQCRRPGGLDRAIISIAVSVDLLLIYLVFREGGVGPTSWWLIIPPYMLVNCGMHRAAIVSLTVNVAFEVCVMLVNRYGSPLASDLGSEPALLFVTSRIGLGIALLSSMIVLDRARASTLARLRRMNADLGAANRAALAAAEAKARFLATMSHEIRTPLNGVMGAAELLKRTTLDGVQGHYLDTLQHSGDHLLELINNVLDFSKLEAGRMELETRPFSVRDVVEDVLDALAPRAHEKGLVLHAFVARDVPACVNGDASRLRQILVNLGANAVKFTHEGEVAIDLRRLPAGDDSPCRLRFAVRDTGIGLDPAQRARLFQAFTQADGSTTRVYGGTGLGLAISNELARLMEGEIDVVSSPGAGAEFHCELDFELAAAPAQPGPPPGPVVVVDPLEPARLGLVETLASLGLQADGQPQPPTTLPSQAVLLLSTRALPALQTDPVVQAACASGRLLLILPYGSAAPASCLDAPLLFEPVRRAQLVAAIAACRTPARAASAPAPAPAPGVTTPRRVLLVEDNPVNLEVAVAMLEQLGCEVDTATDGQQAIERWQRGAHDFVLMDCQMPVLDGFEATRGIRAAELVSGRPRTHIVALTANAFADDRLRCREAGMDDFLSKPFTFAQLRELLSATRAVAA